jgi:hypothetical protein
MSKVTASFDFDRVPEKEVPRYVNIYCDQLTSIVNGGISFRDNMDGFLTSVVFSNSGTDATITHNLGRVPFGYLTCGTTVAMIIYDGTVAANATTITLQASAAGTARLFIF